MATYYCYECARNGPVCPVDPSAMAASQYQLDKFVKHTAPIDVYEINSVFHDPNWSTYQEFIVTAAASGCLEIDDRGRKNLIYFAGKETGLLYESDRFISPCSGFMLVCGESPGRFHAFPSNFEPESRICCRCGKLVPFDPRNAQPF